jgi:ferredoxin, 2Fe-2S
MNMSDKSKKVSRTKTARSLARRLAKRLLPINRGAESGTAQGPHMVSVVGGDGVEIENGSTLLRGLVASGFNINHFCGGNGSCGTCKFEVVDGLKNLQRPTTAEVVAGAASEPHKRLACQARVKGPITIRVKM